MYSQTVTGYQDLKPVLDYMNSHYNKLNKETWATMDNRYIMVLTAKPEDNVVIVITSIRQNR